MVERDQVEIEPVYSGQPAPPHADMGPDVTTSLAAFDPDGPVDGVDDLADLEDEDWMKVQAPRGVRLRVPTLVLLALGVAAGAFWGGAVAQKHNGASSTSSAASAFARLRSSFGSGGTGTGTGGFGGLGGTTATPVTRGTVTEVTPTVLYLTDSTGALVKVSVSSATTITRTSAGTSGALAVGDTATVYGTTGAGGVITATSITDTAPGVSTSSAAGLGGTAGAGGFGSAG